MSWPTTCYHSISKKTFRRSEHLLLRNCHPVRRTIREYVYCLRFPTGLWWLKTILRLRLYFRTLRWWLIIRHSRYPSKSYRSFDHFLTRISCFYMPYCLVAPKEKRSFRWMTGPRCPESRIANNWRINRARQFRQYNW